MHIFNAKRAITLGLALSLAAFGMQVAHAQQAATENSASASAEPASVAKLNDVPPPPPGMGQIVFFRPSRFVGAVYSFSVHEGDKGIGKLTNGTYFVYVTEPGVKEFNMSFESKDALRLEVEEGETYYVLQTVSMGVIAYTPNMTPSSEDAFQAKKLKLTKAKATDRH